MRASNLVRVEKVPDPARRYRTWHAAVLVGGVGQVFIVAVALPLARLVGAAVGRARAVRTTH